MIELFDDSADNNDNQEKTADRLTNIAKQPPAVRVPLTGHYLIEASAGTGKTWTLTGIVLRLLIEAKRAPEHIIATTFTRAAAAEMRERIHKRLIDFHQLLIWLSKLQADLNTHPVLYPQLTKQRFDKSGANSQTLSNSVNNKSTESKVKKATPKPTFEQQKSRWVWLDKQAKLSGIAEILNDPINQHLIEYLLDNAEDYPLTQAIRRCALLLTTLDKLFVGTLDSLSQKWLSEYSAETGHQHGIRISDDEQQVIESIIHDTVRAHHSQLYHQQPTIYNLLEHTNRLTTPSEHIEVAKKSIQFISTPIETVDMGDSIDFAGFHQALIDFKNCQLKDIEPYFDKAYRKSQGFHGTASIGTRADRIGHIQTAIEKYDVLFFMNLDDETQKFYDALPWVFLSKEDGGKGFNNGREEQRQTFINLDSMQALKKVYDNTEQLIRHLDSIVDNLNRDIALKVRQKLPAILEERRETTFALQMVRLNQALTGKQGERLARYIRHHYPVALIDESQDINGEQARMIERIYLPESSPKDPREQDRHRGFLLLVGDPKQAIYGFRGGDVANYNAMKARFDPKNRMSLDINRRSNAGVITALNHWFGRPHSTVNGHQESDNDGRTDDNSESSVGHQLAQLGKGIEYQHITAANDDTKVSWQSSVNSQLSLGQYSNQSSMILPNKPVSIIHLPYNKEAKYNTYELTALHIAALLASGQTIEGRAIKPSDIGVLGRRKTELKQVEEMLSKLGVPTLETAENNVFNTPIATDLAALLEAMLRPNRRDITNRVLTSHFYQLNLQEVQTMMLSLDADATADDHGLNSSSEEAKQYYQDFQAYLKAGAIHWQQGGILSALHFLLGQNPMAESSKTSQGKYRAPNKEQHSIEPYHSSKKTHGHGESNLWVGIANLKDGARHLMDLRHLMDILAQYGMNIGENELLAWYKKQMHSKQTPEWAQQQPLPTESGVQLMTIHKSKGLEFPVVYVVGMDGASNKANNKKGGQNQHKLYLYDHDISNSPTQDHLPQKAERRLSASEGKRHNKSAKGEPQTDYYAKFETNENYEELKRLAYVAFTRASEQLYIVLNDSKDKTDQKFKPVLQWLGALDQKFILPERLFEQVGWINYATLEQQGESILQASQIDTQKASEHNHAREVETIQYIDYQDAHAQIKQHTFKGWTKTSFTALSRQLSEQGKALAVFDDAIEDELDLTDSYAANPSYNDSPQYQNQQSSAITADNVRFQFVKGANAGVFLHQIFERIDFNNNSKWSEVIDHGIRQYQLPLSYSSAYSDDSATLIDNESTSAHQALKEWIADVLATPLLASGQPLSAISVKSRIAEMGFNMGLADDFSPEDINDIFKQHLPQDTHKHIVLNAHYSSHLYRYLRGEIDLVYEHAGKYHVVDYKSNYLGSNINDYDIHHLENAMDKAGYWLQAAIYQVALHRFLKLRLHDYENNEEKYLGAVEYVFLRGIDSQSTHNYGRIQWQMPIALVKALDHLFGKPKN